MSADSQVLPPKISCARCGRETLPSNLLPVPLHFLKAQYPLSWNSDDPVCLNCRSELHRELISHLMGKSHEELDDLEQEVVQSIVDNQMVSNSLENTLESVSWPDRLSDQIADFGGSWYFLSSFAVFLASWIFINSSLLLSKPFDPFPFILLNLALSCLAAIQAPVILMSQKRQESRDRLRAINDYQVNLKAELEIRQLHLKLDLLLSHHWKQLSEIQELQIALLEDILDRLDPKQ